MTPTQRRYKKLEDTNEAEIMALLGRAGSRSAALEEFAEYCATLDQPVPPDVSLSIIKMKARELLNGETE